MTSAGATAVLVAGIVAKPLQVEPVSDWKRTWVENAAL